MFFDPDDGQTLEEKVERVLRRHPALRVRVEAVARVSGRSILDIVAECMARHLDDMKDPAKRAAASSWMEREQAPFGPDPLVKRSDP